MRLLVDKYNLKEDKGSVLMEAIICLPVLLLLSLGVAQFAHIWYCRTIVHYAAYCAARATLTAPGNNDGSQNYAAEWNQASQAAYKICQLVNFSTLQDGEILPGVNNNLAIPGGGRIENKCFVRIIGDRSEAPARRADNIERDDGELREPTLDEWHRGVRVKMHVPLLFPFAGNIIGATMKMWSDNGDLDIRPTTPAAEGRGDSVTGDPNNTSGNFFFPHIVLRERVYIAKPFKSTWTTP